MFLTLYNFNVIYLKVKNTFGKIKFKATTCTNFQQNIKKESSNKKYLETESNPEYPKNFCPLP